MKPFGDRITADDFMNSNDDNVDSMDGATLCGNCQFYFRGDGSLDRCNPCTIENIDEERILRLFFRRCDYCSKGASNIGVVGGSLYVCENCYTDWIIDEAIRHVDNRSFRGTDEKQDWILDINDQIRVGYNSENDWECEYFTTKGASITCEDIRLQVRLGRVIVITQYEEDDQIKDLIWSSSEECLGETLDKGCCYV